MKVLIVNESLGLGGVQSSSIEQANGLVNRGLDVFFCSFPGVLQSRLSPRINYFQIPKWSISTSFKIFQTLSNIISTINPDIIHCHSATVGVLAGMAARRVGSKSLKILTDQSPSFSRRVPSPFAAYLLKRHFEHMIAVSRAKLRDLIKLGVVKERISLIPNMVDCNAIENKLECTNKEQVYRALEIDQNSYVISMAGRLVPAKGFDRFIRIIARVSEIHNIQFVGLIIGDGPARSELEAIAAHVMDVAKFCFLGFQENIFQYLAISNLVLFPSSWQEVLPMFLIESTTIGLPIVCSDIPGNRDIVRHGVNGFLVNHPGDEEQYCEYLLQLVTDQALAKEMSNSSRKIARDLFDKQVVIKNVIDLYQELVEGRLSV